MEKPVGNYSAYVLEKEEVKQWLEAQHQAGNRVEELNLLWQYPAESQNPFAIILHTKVWVTDEARFKENEFVFFRPDLVCVCIYCPAKNILDTEILLVREFRSACRNKRCKVLELPSGSIKKVMWDSLRDELEEELNLDLDRYAAEYLGYRQLVSTLSGNVAHLVAIRCNKRKWKEIEEKEGYIGGVEQDSERTYAAIMSLRDILEANDVDWSTLGMILYTVLTDKKGE